MVGSLIWFPLLIVLYLLGRLWCIYADTPNDCQPTWDTFDAAENLEAIMIYGATLGFLVGVFDKERLDWLRTTPRCYPLVLLMVAACPIFSLLSDVIANNGVNSTAASGSTLSGGGVAVITGLGIALVGLVGWHCHFYWRSSAALH